ncbi:O-antigen ligase family protein [Oxalobacteraceae bacterium R-40]|uniref:O-antigen ligase family protein n=1 Tax=Keguizhuia sedimenti TaxID=3064264 RepID=A0ABU1BLM7_9BURK|nr:O-antigen ligase family protein [Oxalobacteraceae bacterium R-40]
MLIFKNPLLYLLPTFISFIPVEILGVDGEFLQRIVISGNSIPYWDAFLFIGILGYVLVMPSRCPRQIRLVVGAMFLQAFLYLIFRSSAPPNQIIGMWLSFSSVGLVVLLSGHKKILSTVTLIHRFIPVLLGFFCLLVIGLGASLYWPALASQELLVTIDRFDGGDFRLRWKTVRQTDEFVLALLSAWCALQVFEKAKLIYLVPLVVLFSSQLLHSSRGGILLVMICSLVTFLFFIKRTPGSSSMKGIIVSVLAFLTLFWIMIWGVNHPIIANFGEVAQDDTIRGRMKEAAMNLFYNNPVFGNGFFELHATEEWRPFLLDHMLLPIHNVLLHYLVYMGIVGGLLFVALLVVLGVIQFRNLRQNAHLPEPLRWFQALSFAVYISAVYMVIFQSFDRLTLMLFWTIMGLSIAVNLSYPARSMGKMKKQTLPTYGQSKD